MKVVYTHVRCISGQPSFNVTVHEPHTGIRIQRKGYNESESLYEGSPEKQQK